MLSVRCKVTLTMHAVDQQSKDSVATKQEYDKRLPRPTQLGSVTRASSARLKADVQRSFLLAISPNTLSIHLRRQASFLVSFGRVADIRMHSKCRIAQQKNVA